jgi:hypothetical protein
MVRALTVLHDRSPVRSLVDEMDNVALTDEPWSTDADVVIVEAAALPSLSEPMRAALIALCSALERPPIIAFVAPGETVAELNADQLVPLPSPEGTGGFAWFERGRAVNLPPTSSPDRTERMGPLAVAYSSDAPLYAYPAAPLDVWRSTTAVDLMACGVPVLRTASEASEREPIPHLDLLRASVAQRRLMHARARSDLHIRTLLRDAGIPLPASVAGHVAAVLMSRRPERVTQAAEAMLSQQDPPHRLTIGLHGAEAAAATPDLERLASRGTAIDIQVFDSDRSLGACLNDLIAECPEPLIAKIDDDDLYAPGYLTDAVQALDYSGAALVGKATYLLHTVQGDRTYLLNGGKE